MSRYKIIPNGLWQKEITESYPKENKLTEESIRESLKEEIRNTFAPERNVVVRTGPLGQEMLRQALRNEISRRALDLPGHPAIEYPEPITPTESHRMEILDISNVNMPQMSSNPIVSSIMQNNNVFPVEQLRERIQELREEPEIDYLEQLDQMSNE